MPRWVYVLALVGVLAVLAALAITHGEKRALIAMVGVSAVLFGLQHQRRWPRWARLALVAFSALVLVPFLTWSAGAIAHNLREVPEWDFKGFWLHARSAAAGLDFYDPQTLQQSTAGMTLSRGFQSEIVNLPFWYPPPSMFLFLPLGWFESATSALTFWYALQIAILAAAAVLLWRLHFPGGDAVELAACVPLVCLCHGTAATFFYGQTNFMALAALLLFWRKRDTLGGGAWAAVALFVKPFLGVLALWMLIENRRRALAGFLLAIVIFCAASLVVFGPQTCAAYFTGNQLETKPAAVYTEKSNQSLLGWVLRSTGAECKGAQCVRNPWFVALGGAVGVTTLAAAYRLRGSRDREWSLALLVACGLLMYPATQFHYSVAILPALLLAWRERERIPGGAAAAGFVTVAVYVCLALGGGGRTFYAFAILWLSLALACFALARGRGWRLQPAAVE